MRRSFLFFATSAAPAGATAAGAAAAALNTKMQALHKILTGEIHFKNKTPVKECNIVHQFGEKWAEELSAYASKLPAEQKKIIERQVARLKLTRYTTRELAMYCGEGPENLDAVARDANIEDGVTYYKLKGPEAFEQYVKEEAANSGWKPEDAKKFIDAVKQNAK